MLAPIRASAPPRPFDVSTRQLAEIRSGDIRSVEMRSGSEPEAIDNRAQPASRRGPAVAAPDFTRAFDRTHGWTGADGTYSLRLRDGRTLWLFSDTLIGDVDGARRRTLDPNIVPNGMGAPLVNNSAALQTGNDPAAIEFVLGRREGAYCSIFSPPDGAGIFWVNGAVNNDDGSVTVLLNRFEKSDDPRFPFGRAAGVYAARVEIDGNDLRVLRYTKLHDVDDVPPAVEGEDRAEISWGAELIVDGDWAYAYSAVVTKKDRSQRRLLLSRVPADQIEDPDAWQHFSGSGWTKDVANSELQNVPMANEVSVHRIDGAFVMIAQMAHGPVHARVALGPEGPWSSPHLVYDPPEHRLPDVTYHAKAHPHLSDARGLLISYNVNSTATERSLFDADVYRPRFVRIPPEKLRHMIRRGVAELSAQSAT